ncbi:MAG: PQQ-dependent sugar dehydrogenase [Phenylobacterium sp.]
MRAPACLALLLAAASAGGALAQAAAPQAPPDMSKWTAKPGPMSILSAQATREPYGPKHDQPLSLPLRPGSGGMPGARQPAEGGAPGQVLETRPAMFPSQKPAFEGQTRARAVRTQTPIETKIIAKGLDKPWALAFLPDGQILLAEKPGKLRLVTQAGKLGPDIEGVPPVFFVGDGGLFDVEIDPAFKSNRTFYLSFVGYRPDGNALMVVKAQLSRDGRRMENIVQLLTMPSFNNMAHYGGRMLLAPDGTLLLGASERMDDAVRLLAQDPASPMGKVLRINTDGSIPKDNPYVDVTGAEPRVWTLGNRDVQGFAVHPTTGKVWISDHGPQAGDEIDILEPGHNYGWPLVAYGGEYSGSLITGGRTQWPGTDQPEYYWDPSIAPSGIAFYSGGLIPEWRGNLFVTALNGRHLARLVLDGDKVVGEERLLLEQKQRVRDVAQGPDGALWVVTDDVDGRLIRLAPTGK